MRMYVVQTPDGGDLTSFCDAAREGRAAAKARRRALAAGRSALAPAPEQVCTGLPEADVRASVAAVDATPPARQARSISMQRRRQLAKGKRALNGGGDRTAAAAGEGAPVLVVYRGGGC